MAAGWGGGGNCISSVSTSYQSYSLFFLVFYCFLMVLHGFGMVWKGLGGFGKGGEGCGGHRVTGWGIFYIFFQVLRLIGRKSI